MNCKETRSELPNHEWSDQMKWGQQGVAILTAEDDASRVTQTAHLRSFVRSSTQITLPRPFRVGGFELHDCIYYFSDTDFGKRKHFGCDEGLVAEEEELSAMRWAPSIRIVAAEKIRGTFPIVADIKHPLPYFGLL